MTSYLIDKLEALKEDENKLKEKQRILQEEIELEIEKQRRLEMGGTITKLKTQLSMLSKNIEGEIMPDNYQLVIQTGTKKINKEQVILEQKKKRGLIDMPEYNRKNQDLVDRRINLSREQQDRDQYNHGSPASFITLEKFKENLSETDEEVKERFINSGRIFKNNVDIPFEIKIYDEIIPIFTTMIGIMKKQEYEITTLKSNIARTNNLESSN
jgi:hypothetical protein